MNNSKYMSRQLNANSRKAFFFNEFHLSSQRMQA